MARTRVKEYTRQLASGTQVTVHGHERRYQGGTAHPESKRTPVMTHQRELARERNRLRRQEAMRRAGDAATKGWERIKRRGRWTRKMLRRGGRRLRRAGRYLARRRRTMAALCVVGGLAEVGAGLLWSTAGVIFTTVSILVAAISGGLLIGGPRSARPRHAKDTAASRAAVRAAKARQRAAQP